jgi:hypothetical protein
MDRKRETEMLVAILTSLNAVEVKGQNNVFTLGGCMRLLQDILDARVVADREAAQASIAKEPTEKGGN